jgi:hypothetical protein
MKDSNICMLSHFIDSLKSYISFTDGVKFDQYDKKNNYSSQILF